MTDGCKGTPEWCEQLGHSPPTDNLNDQSGCRFARLGIHSRKAILSPITHSSRLHEAARGYSGPRPGGNH